MEVCIVTDFIVIRHGEGQGNLAGEFHGQYDSDLTPLGQDQARCTAQYLKNFPIDCIYSSDLKRAYHTALAIAELHDLPVVKDRELREIDAGKWEQMAFAKIQADYPEEYRLWMEDKANCKIPGGESVYQLMLRIQRAFCRLAAIHSGKTVCVVTHSTPIRVMRCLWKSGTESLAAIDSFGWVCNASVTIARYMDDGRYELVLDNESRHLIGVTSNLPTNI